MVRERFTARCPGSGEGTGLLLGRRRDSSSGLIVRPPSSWERGCSDATGVRGGLGLGLGLPFGVVLLASSCSLIGCVELEALEVSGMAELDVTGHRFAMNDWYL